MFLRLAFGFLIFGFSIGVICAQAGAAVYITNTNIGGQFVSGSDNQGWFTNGFVGSNASNPNYFMGFQSNFVGASDTRDFFSFLIPTLGVNEVITNVELDLRRGSSSPTNESSETIGFWDFTSASAATLNNFNGFNGTFFADLGSGTSYGNFTVPGSNPNLNAVLSFSLNTSAIAAITANQGNYFTLGGSLLSQDGNDFLFGATDNTDPQQLIITTTVINQGEAVPEPASLAIWGIGVLGCAIGAHRRRKPSA